MCDGSLGGFHLGLFDVSEAFAPVQLRWARELGVSLDRVNGGAIAPGHPVGASGARLMATLVHEMNRQRNRYGLQTMCEGDELANATVLQLAQ